MNVSSDEIKNEIEEKSEFEYVEVENELEIPENYLCPILQEPMKDPVVAADGHSYERTAIEQWFKGGSRISPMTGARLAHTTLIDNIRLKAVISDFIKKYPIEIQTHTDLLMAINLREEFIARALEKRERRETRQSDSDRQPVSCMCRRRE